MTDATGVIVAIELAILTLMIVLAYFNVSRFLETSRMSHKRVCDQWDKIGEKFTASLARFDDLADVLKTTVVDIRAKMEIIERDLSPLARNLDRTLTDAGPFVKSLSDSSENITTASENVRNVVGKFSDVVGGLHEAIVPTMKNLRSLLNGINEGLRVLRIGRNPDEE